MDTGTGKPWVYAVMLLKFKKFVQGSCRENFRWVLSIKSVACMREEIQREGEKEWGSEGVREWGSEGVKDDKGVGKGTTDL
jgi:hypothetical protein